MSKNPIAREVAEQEVQDWLDFKKVNARKRQNYKENIETLVDSIVVGILTLNDDKSFVQKLNFPLGEEGKEATITTLTYKPRIKVQTVQVCLQGIKPADADGRVCGYISALTGTDRNIIKQLDTEDYSIGESIAIFFL